MFSLRRLVGFVVRVLILYALLAAPWPGVQRAYSALFRAAGDVLFGSFGNGARARFQPALQAEGNTDVSVVVQTFSPPAHQATLLSSRRTGYLPVAQFLALILATPISWPRKWKALVWGMILVNGFIVARVWGILFFTGSTIAPSTFAVGQFSADLVSILISPTPAFLVPAVVWLMVSIRRADLVRIGPALRRQTR